MHGDTLCTPSPLQSAPPALRLSAGPSLSRLAATITLALLLVALKASGTGIRKACPDGCAVYGTCYEPLGRCDCPWNRTGDACQDLYIGFCVQRLNMDNPVDTCNDDHPTLCVNGCVGRGRCMGGFCHCQAGFFGTDCSLSYNEAGTEVEVLAGLGYQPGGRGPRVYVYQLPPEYHVKRNLHNVDRPPLHLAILERLLTAGHVTANPAEADYYYLPVSGREMKKAHLLQPMLRYVSQTWPFWNRTQGRLHVLTVDGDVGVCDLPRLPRQEMENVTFLQFWGMHGFHPLWKHIFYVPIPCFKRQRDIVVPFMAMSSHDRSVIHTPLHPKNPKPSRNITFFFAGGICGSGNKLITNCTHYKQLRYSGGVRQEVFDRYNNRPGWRVVKGTKNYGLDYSKSKYCLAAAGGGFGKRGIVAAMYGCVPVAATDFLYEAFEPEIGWNETGFGIKISQSDIQNLPALLQSISPAQLAEMQRRVKCAAQHFHWSSNLGSIFLETGEFDAFATTMMILHMRTKRPDLQPEQYYREDEEFRGFVDCKPSPTPITRTAKPAPQRPLPPHPPHPPYPAARPLGAAAPPTVGPPPLCAMYVGPLQIRWESTCPAAKYYMRRKIGPPGGAACVGAQDLAHCTRFH